jgi:tryptophanyl-tRNA synthetase
LHLGNYLGALVRFAKMSVDPAYQCFFFVADLHTLTTLKEAREIREHMPNIVLDYLAAGVDPNRAAIYLQSDIPRVAELAWYLACLTPVGELGRLPTFKDKSAKQPEDVNAGLLFYPVLMAADILGPRADLVPVGRDQKPHLELAAELARKFNRLYGGDYFPIPDALEQEMILVPGLALFDEEHGGFPKMGKSDANTVNLADTAEETWEKIRVSATDPQRQRRTDPGDPSRCAIFALHELMSNGAEIARVQDECPKAAIGCVDCKRILAANVNNLLAPFRERRHELAQRPTLVQEVLAAGREKVEPIFEETLEVVRARVGIQPRRTTAPTPPPPTENALCPNCGLRFGATLSGQSVDCPICKTGQVLPVVQIDQERFYCSRCNVRFPGSSETVKCSSCGAQHVVQHPQTQEVSREN